MTIVVKVDDEGAEDEGCGEDVCMGQRGLREPDWIASSENGDGESGGRAEKILCEPKDCEQAGGSEGAGKKARRKDVVSRDVPERAEQDVGQRWMCVGVVRDDPAVMVEVERGRDVVTGFVPEIREAEKREMRERDGGEEEREENEVRERGEAGRCGVDSALK